MKVAEREGNGMTEVLEVLKRDGIAILPEPMPPEQIDAFMKYLSARPILDGWVPAKGRGAKGDPASSASTSWAMHDVLMAPHFFEFAVSLTALAGDYLGCEPTLYSFNAFTTYPRQGPTVPDIQEFHRDYDDTKFVGLFVLCSDVASSEDGAHEFVKGSHMDANREIVAVTGPVGTAFLAATSGLHRGLRPQHRPRSIAWARWSVSPRPVAYGWDETSPMPGSRLGARYPADRKMRDSLRLVVSEE